MVSFRVDDGVILREFTAADADAVYEVVMKNYDHLRRFMHWLGPDYSVQSAREFIARSEQLRNERKGLSLAIIRYDAFIGSIGFVSFDWLARKTEIGYWICEEWEGKGIISRSTELLIKHAFIELEMNRIEIRCSAENLRSSAIPKRFGFIKEGNLRQSEFRDGRLHDFEIHGLLAADWKLFEFEII